MYSIIGGGIAGLTTALAFEKLGIPYALYEKAESLKAIGSGILLPPNALQVYDWLGILNAIELKGSPMTRITLAKSDFSPLFDYHQHDVKKIYGHHAISIHRGALQKILLDQIPKQKIHLNKSLQEFRQQKEKVQLFFEDGSSVISGFLIGADGIRSKLRQQLFPDSKLRYSGQTCWRGVCTVDDEISEKFEHRGIEMWGEQMRFGISKIEKDRVYWFAVVLSLPDQKDIPDEIVGELAKKFKNFHPIVAYLIAITDKKDIIRSDLYDVELLSKWYDKNICLIGDAAHATTPNMGQGGAQAIEDAYFLAHLIKENPDQNIFAQFHKKRKRKVTKVVKRSWSLGQVGHWKNMERVRNFLLKTLPRPILKAEWRSIYKLK